MAELTINEKLIIDDDENVVRWLEERSGCTGFTIDDIVHFIKTEAQTIFYLDDKMTIKDENDKGIKYVWLDSGLQEPDGKAIFISLYASYGYFIGHYVGTYKFLSKSVSEWSPHNQRFIRDNAEKFGVKYEKRIEKRAIKHITERYQHLKSNEEEKMAGEPVGSDFAQKVRAAGFEVHGELTEVKETTKTNMEPEPKNYVRLTSQTAITENVYHQLLIDNWKSIEGLDRYIKIIGCRLQQLIAQKKEDYYILNNIKSAVVNTGLLNKFGTDILVHYRLNVTYDVYEAYQLIESKSDMLANNFSREQVSREIKPINFFDDGEIPFSASIEDFDINYRNLFHIIEERRERFPEHIQDISTNSLASKINHALELGLKMQQRDRNYAKPIYSTKTGTVSWMMPLHIDNELVQDPELVMILRKAGEFYEIKTVLPYDDEIKDRITALSLYDGMW